jgi:hypothetical protein
MGRPRPAGAPPSRLRAHLAHELLDGGLHLGVWRQRLLLLAATLRAAAAAPCLLAAAARLLGSRLLGRCGRLGGGRRRLGLGLGLGRGGRSPRLFLLRRVLVVGLLLLLGRRRRLGLGRLGRRAGIGAALGLLLVLGVWGQAHRGGAGLRFSAGGGPAQARTHRSPHPRHALTPKTLPPALPPPAAHTSLLESSPPSSSSLSSALAFFLAGAALAVLPAALAFFAAAFSFFFASRSRLRAAAAFFLSAWVEAGGKEPRKLWPGARGAAKEQTAAGTAPIPTLPHGSRHNQTPPPPRPRQGPTSAARSLSPSSMPAPTPVAPLPPPPGAPPPLPGPSPPASWGAPGT